MADLIVLDAGVRRAEEELARAQAFFALGGGMRDDAKLAALTQAVDDARAARAAVATVAPDSQPAQAAKPKPAGTLMGAETTGLVATVVQRMDRVATSLGHLHALRGTPLVSVTVENKSVDRTRRVAVRCHIEGYSAEAIATREIAPERSATVDLFPPLFPERVRELHELTAAALHVRVDDLDTQKPELVMAQPIPLLPPTTAVLGYRDPKTGKTEDQRDLLAAYVTPSSPEVLELLRTAADATKLKAMIGYQAVSADDVREQVRAIYTALAAAKIQYIDTRVAFGASAGETIQRIRLPRESLASRSANCIDGTVLMASVLEATGLDPFIVIVPGHAYLGYRLRAGDAPEAAEYVETTVVGTRPYDEAFRIAMDRSKTANPIRRVDVRAQRAAGITPME